MRVQECGNVYVCVPSSAEVSLLMFVHSQGVPSSADLIHP